ncbi:RagB/SusD family nutrient uptake outer membrane protein [Bacteroidales bacterium OttesenSCG-928-I14]|nr:RagB/SusD family nutrient uptake outer membrane protein [Bacteroidales bacterium OttesenSCG-928-I14]
MKQNKYLAFIAGLGLLFFGACTDNYENFPVEKFTEDYVFSETDSLGVEAQKFMNNIYIFMRNGHNGIGGDYLDAASDDAISIKQNDPDVYKLAVGRYSASSRISSDMEWGEYYEGIRNANILIKNIDRVPFATKYVKALGGDTVLNASLKAEARFLRAYFYFELVKRYGGVPLMGDKVYKLGDNMEKARNSFAECIEYISTELEDIEPDMRSINMSTEDKKAYAHIATAEAAAALRSRVLLYAASPLFNEKPIATNDARLIELVGYPDYDINRWGKAADAAKHFIETYGHLGNGNIDLSRLFINTFLNHYGSANPELIFFRQGGKDNSIETKNGPLGFSGKALGNGRTNPTQNLVDAFLMKDGKFIGESTKYAYNPQRPYENRDPRLDLTILHHESKWLGRVLDTSKGGGNNPTNSAEYTKTSYYMRKFMGNFVTTPEYDTNYHLWVMFRYAEILLNYAEALNEYNAAPTKEVYDIIVKLRKRAGLDAGTNKLYGLEDGMTKEEMRKVIQNERRIEMAFEEHRYWDIRRWRLAEEIFQTPLKGIDIVKTVSSTTYTEVDVLKINFEEKRYLYPIPYSECIKNSNMVQNPKW